MTDQPPGPSGPPPGNYPPPPGPPPGNYPPPPPGNYPPPPPPGGGGYPPPAYGAAPGAVGNLPQEAYTPWIVRVGAYFIDVIPVFVVMAIAYGIAFGTGENDCVRSEQGYGGSCASTFSGVGIAAVALASLASLAYGIWNYGYRQGTTGSSIGKSVLKFKVVSEATGQPIGFGMSIVRQLAHFVDSIICNIGYLFPLWDTKRQTLADKIMTTVCVPTS